MFSGSHCVSSGIFRYIPDRDVSDLTGDVYQPLIARGEEKIAAGATVIAAGCYSAKIAGVSKRLGPDRLK